MTKSSKLADVLFNGQASIDRTVFVSTFKKRLFMFKAVLLLTNKS